MSAQRRSLKALVAGWQDEGHLQAFTVYLNYVRSFDHLICSHYGDGEEVDFAALADAIRSTPSFGPNLRRERSAELYEKHLKNAWFTEVALNIPDIFTLPELVPYFNHWATVMAYYVVHHGMRAAIAVRGGQPTMTRSHQSLLNQAGAYLANSRVFPVTWSVVCTGHEGDHQYACRPDDATSECRSLLKRFEAEDAWPFFCKALATTRDRAIGERIDQWKQQQHRTRIRRSLRCTIGQAVQPTTFLNFLLRLRLRSNYLDSDAFAAALTREGDAADFNRSIRNIVAGSMMVCETLITAMAGDSDIRRIAEWTTSRIEGAQMTVGRRMPYWSE